MLPRRYEPYNHDWETCSDTYATLRLYPGDIAPSEVSQLLELSPDETQIKGNTYIRDSKPWKAPINGWFLSSKGKVTSRDSRRHLDWLLDILTPRAGALSSLSARGMRGDICCMWDSAHGHGGPQLDPAQMQRLCELDFVIWFDVYGPWEITGGT